MGRGFQADRCLKAADRRRKTIVCPTGLLLICVSLAAAAAPIKVEVRTPQGNRTLELPLEKYVAGVLAGESSVFRSNEALKAMAVAARTYAVRLRGRHASEGFDFCATTHCQRLDLDAVTSRLESIAAETSGELLWFEGKPAFACYSRDCGGRTEDAGAVWPDLAAPYLKSHDDPYCTRGGAAPWQWSADPLQVAEALRRSQLRTPRLVEGIAVAQRTPSGRARTLVLSGGGEPLRISAGSFRFAMGRELGWNTVESDRYEIRSSNGRAVFEGSGSGHGVGLCQRGADQMGLAGRTYREILAFYYPGTVVGRTGRGISWQRLGGDGVSLLTTHADGDSAVLELTERTLRRVSQQTNLPMPRDIEVRIYPDVETFRNATGEPGWVAAHTVGRRIHLQPAELLRNRGALETTLRHELLHVMVESQAKAGLPLWFREGLVGWLAEKRGNRSLTVAAPTGPVVPSDADLRQTQDAALARRAYADATRAVADLVDRYGLASVVEWIKAGLPPEVRNASSSQAATKSR
ncbi:MAG: SpoIID/LytB domain-containing protein [Acidobacteriia bacterium]|nr:SpoIID/LytB domain-containing protein [Terriglobia bacterium]